jgi:hypothetical protein
MLPICEKIYNSAENGVDIRIISLRTILKAKKNQLLMAITIG